jgi:hypothetical protein
VTLAEAEYNVETARLEVALQVSPLDLQRALSLHLDRRVDLDREPELERFVVGYLRKVFTVFDAEGREAPVHWVGMQLDLRDAWLYFEVELPAGIEGAVISNRTFFELEERQVNTVNLRLPSPDDSGTELRTLQFTRERASATVD